MIRIVRKSTLDGLIDSNSNQFFELYRLSEEIEELELEIEALEALLHEAKAENQRLFDHHNKRLQKPKKDKNGVLRDKYGRFAKK